MTYGVNAINSNTVDYKQWINQNGGIKETATNPVETTKSDSVEINTKQASSDECTDGKDDGKIGFFSAVTNFFKGAAKTAVNGLKGMFTNKEGKFSLGKTLLSALTVGACIAFPAVGLAACAVGGVMGAVQLGKGAYHAATAKTDAEAKAAWQNMGGGALTVGVSVAGAKASYGAMKATSTAGSSGASALDSLGENATIGQKAVALGKDAISSTKNGFTNVKSGLSTAKEAADLKLAEHKASKIDTKKALTDEELSILKEAEVRETFASDGAKAVVEKFDTAKASATDLAKDIVGKTKNAAKHPIKTVKSGIETLKNIDIKSLPSSVSEHTKNILFVIKDEGYSQALSKYGYDTIADALETVAGFELTDQAV